MKTRITILIFIFSFSAQTLAENIFIHTDSLSEQQFESTVQNLKGTSVVDFFLSRYRFNREFDFSNINSSERIQLSIQTLEAQPLLRGDSEILVGLYQKMYLLNPKAVPLSRIAGIFLSHSELQEYYFDFWEQIKSQIKLNHITASQSQQIQNILKAQQFILIDGKNLKIENCDQLVAMPHQWLLFSNSAVPILYQGTIEGFLDKVQEVKKPSDLCFSEIMPFSTSPQFQLTVLNSDPLCQTRKQSTNTTADHSQNNYYQQNKQWLIPVGIGLGAALVWGLKDKKIAVKLPGFSF